jgi:hypothetical protein
MMGLGIELDGTLHWVPAKQRHDVHAQAYMYIYLLTRRASMPVQSCFLAMHVMEFKQGIFEMKLK